jgi:phosphonate transport system substrate-binding protein
VTIWEGIRSYFREAGVPFDFALFSNYERQVESLLEGAIDIAWNTPLAHVRVQQRTQGRSLSLGMRDSDRDFSAKIIVRKDAGIRTLADLRGKVLAVGSADSTQARIIPLHFLKKGGVDLDRVTLLPFDTDLGKHGDTGTSELDVLAALTDGRAQAGAVGDLVWVTEQAGARVDLKRLEVLATTMPFDHCMFDALPELPPGQIDAFQKALFAMSWENPTHRRLLELEGLKQWLPARPSEKEPHDGYASLREALG